MTSDFRSGTRRGQEGAIGAAANAAMGAGAGAGAPPTWCTLSGTFGFTGPCYEGKMITKELLDINPMDSTLEETLGLKKWFWSIPPRNDALLEDVLYPNARAPPTCWWNAASIQPYASLQATRIGCLSRFQLLCTSRSLKICRRNLF